jgi:hypothetical protein
VRLVCVTAWIGAEPGPGRLGRRSSGSLEEARREEKVVLDDDTVESLCSSRIRWKFVVVRVGAGCVSVWGSAVMS